MRETNSITDLKDDCFRDLKPAFWLPLAFTAQRPQKTSAASRGTTVAPEMLKAPVAIHPVVTQPPALPADQAAPRLRCPSEPICARRSSVSRRVSAIAELRSQRKIQTPPLPPPPPLPRPGGRPPKQLMPSTPRAESPQGRQPRWLSSCPSERGPQKVKVSNTKRLENLSPHNMCPHVRSLTFSDNFDLGELPRLRLQHRNGARCDPTPVLTNLQVHCLPLCRALPRMTSDMSGSAVTLPQRHPEVSLPGVKANVPPPLTSGESNAVGRGSLREKRELLSPAIATKESTSRRPPPAVKEPSIEVTPSCSLSKEDDGSISEKRPSSKEESSASCKGSLSKEEVSSTSRGPSSKEEGSNKFPVSRILPRHVDAGNGARHEHTMLGDAVKLTQVPTKSASNESGNKSNSSAQDLTDGMLVCTHLAGSRSVTTLMESPGGRMLNGGTLSAVSRRTRPFSVISNGSTKPPKNSVITDGACEYPDPFSGASASFQQRLMDLSSQENETIRWEKMRAARRKPRFLNRQD